MLEDLLLLLELAVAVPAARRDVALLDLPELQLFLDGGSAEVVRQMQLVRAVKVQDKVEQRRVPVEEPLLGDRVVVVVRLLEVGQARVGYPLQCLFGGDEAGAPYVEGDKLAQVDLQGRFPRVHGRLHLHSGSVGGGQCLEEVVRGVGHLHALTLVRHVGRHGARPHGPARAGAQTTRIELVRVQVGVVVGVRGVV